MSKAFWTVFTLCALSAVFANQASAQLPDPAQLAPKQSGNLLSDPTMTPEKALLFDLENNFAKDVALRGGQAFIDRMAKDCVLLGNGQAPVQGWDKLCKNMSWTTKDYQLTWTPTDARMDPSGDMGFTWGHFEGKYTDANGFPQVSKGRYMTIWRKEKNGDWKIVLDMGANEPAETAACSANGQQSSSTGCRKEY